MSRIQKNLTPFYWGPKATSRKPPQVEMAVCVRGVFRLAPGQPLEPIEDEIDQGFMSGEVWAEDDPDRVGPITRHSDFADWKPNADLLLKGTCHPPGGRDIACDVAWGVGDWSKTLRVYGPRIFVPGLLFGGTVSDPQTFTSMPLTWENAYGGPGYALNPAGKGFSSPLLPNVEDPNRPLKKSGQKKLPPASFLPISSLWPQRWSKVGKNYGEEWQKTRAPFVSDDFDWSHYNSAPADQQLDGYLNGNELVWFENLHPEAARFEVRLPGLRIRSLVKTDDGAIHDLKFVLDTLYADLDAGRLELTWRALTPIRELDMTDVTVVLVASEQLSDAPLPAEHYQRLLEEFEDDPVGLKTKFPPGFMEVAKALEAAEKADLHGTPKPDFAKVAAALPADSFVAPWCIEALGLKDDPDKLLELSSKASGRPNPLAGVSLEQLRALKDRPPEELADELDAMATRVEPKIGQALQKSAAQLRLGAKLKEPGSDDPLTALEKLASALPSEVGAAIMAARANVQQGLAKAAELGGAPSAPPKPELTPAEELAALPAKVREQLGDLANTEDGQAALAKLEATPSLDEAVGQALAPLDQVVLPEPAEIPRISDHMGWMDTNEAMWRRRIGDHPLLSLFDMGRRMAARGDAKIASMALNTGPVLDGVAKAGAALAAIGVGAAALAPLTRFEERLEAMLGKLPGAQSRPENRDYAYQELDGAEFDGQDLHGKSFAKASLKGASFAGADLRDADLRGAELSGANLTGANLSGARLTGARLGNANLSNCDLSQADLSDTLLTEANLSSAKLVGANLSSAQCDKATLDDADLSSAQATEIVLSSASLRRARLDGANLEQSLGDEAQLENASLVGAKLAMAVLNKANLTNADMSRCELGMTMLRSTKAAGLKLGQAKINMAQFGGSILRGADLREVYASLSSFEGCHLHGADFRGATLERLNLTEAILDDADLRDTKTVNLDFMKVQAANTDFRGADLQGCTAIKATFSGCTFRKARGARSTWMEADLSHSDFSHSSFEHSLFQAAKGTGVRFYAAHLKHTSFRSAELAATTFVRADLCFGDLNDSTLRDVQFTSANCFNAKFMDAQLDGCDFLEAALYLARFDRTEGAPQ